MTCVGSFDSVRSVRIVRDAGMVCVSRSLEIKHAAGELETMATSQKNDSYENKEYRKKGFARIARVTFVHGLWYVGIGKRTTKSAPRPERLAAPPWWDFSWRVGRRTYDRERIDPPDDGDRLGAHQGSPSRCFLLLGVARRPEFQAWNLWLW